MAKFRKTIQRELLQALDDSPFTSDDFDIYYEAKDENSKELDVFVRFKHQYDFVYSVYNHDSYWPIIRSPGKVQDSEYFQFDTFDKVLKDISEWAVEVRHELKAQQPIYAEIDALKELIEAQIRSSIDVSDQEFSAAEIANLINKFEELSKRVEQLEKDKAITESQLKIIQDGISQVKEDIEYYPKDTWLKTASNKLSKSIVTIAKTKEGRSILSSGAKKLLGIE